MAENPWIPLLELTGTFKVDDLPEFDTGQLIDRATKAKDDAEKEIIYGGSISTFLASEDETRESKKSLATIGVWHYECALELFNKALRNYGRAQSRGLSQDKQKEVESHIEECRKQIVAAVEEKKSVEDLLDSMKI